MTSVYFTVTKATYRSLLNRVAEKLLIAETRAYSRPGSATGRSMSERTIKRLGKVRKWLEKRLKAARSEGAPDRKRFISDRPATLESKGLYAGQPVSHRHGGRATVTAEDAPAGWVVVRTESNGLETWRVSETRTRLGTRTTLGQLRLVTG